MSNCAECFIWSILDAKYIKQTNYSCNTLSEEYENIEIAMEQCSNNSKCSGVQDKACNGKSFELCDKEKHKIMEKSCIYAKQRNYHFFLFLK